MLKLGPFTIDLKHGHIEGPGARARLTHKEAKLLRYFVENSGADLPRARILAAVFEYGPKTQSRALDTMVRKLRKKIEVCPAAPHYLLTVYGLGYRFEAPSPALPQQNEPAPSNILAPTDAFYGRIAELEALSQALEMGRRIVALVGPPGVGKSRLAQAWALQALDGENQPWPGGIHHCDITSIPDGDALLSHLLFSLNHGLPPGSQRQLLPRIQSILAGRGRGILILDGLNIEPTQILPLLFRLLQGTPQLRLILTTQWHVADERIHPLKIGPLPEADALALLLSGALPPEDDAELARLKAIIQRLAALPLALKLARARLQILSPQALLTRLQDAGPLLSGAQHSQALAASLKRAIEALSPAEMGALLAMAPFEGAFSLADLSPHLGQASAELAIEKLLARSLLTAQGLSLEHPFPTFIVMAPIRHYLRLNYGHRADYQRANTAHRHALQMLCRALIDHSKAHLPRRLPPIADLNRALRDAWQGDAESAPLYLDALWQIHRLRGSLQCILPDLDRAAHKWRGANLNLLHLIRLEYALLTGGLEDAPQLLDTADTLDPHHPHQGRLLLAKLWVFSALGETTAAAQSLDELKACCEKAERPWAAAGGLMLWERALEAKNQPADAEEIARGAVRLATRANAPLTEARALGNLANLLSRRQKYAEAKGYFQRAHTLLSTSPSLMDRVALYFNWGQAELIQGEAAEALVYFSKALSIAQYSAFEGGQFFSRLNLAIAHHLLGQLIAADILFDRLLSRLHGQALSVEITVLAFSAALNADLKRPRRAGQLARAARERAQKESTQNQARQSFLELLHFYIKLPRPHPQTPPSADLKERWHALWQRQAHIPAFYKDWEFLIYLQKIVIQFAQRRGLAPACVPSLARGL